MNGIIEKDLSQLVIVSSKATENSWHPLLRRGVEIAFGQAVTVRQFMTNILGMDEDYATHKVPGLFLNNAPVDDWSTELLGDKDELAMSGTMPGMAGIALRRSSPIRSFREDLHSHHDPVAPAGGAAVVRMFNFIAHDCGKEVLHRGVQASGADLLEYLTEQEISLEESTLSWNAQPVQAEQLRSKLREAPEKIRIRVEFA